MSGNGGVSSAGYVGSPVPSESEQKSTVESVTDTVRSMIGGLGLGGGGPGGETSAGETSTAEPPTGEPSTGETSTTEETKNAPSQPGTDSTSEEAVAGGAAGAAATTATAPAVSEYPKVISPEEDNERKTHSTTDSTSKEAVAGGAAGAAATTTAAPAVSEYPKVISAEVDNERKAYNTTTPGETSNISATPDPSGETSNISATPDPSGDNPAETVTSTAATGATSEEGVMADSDTKDDQHEVEHKPNEGGGPGEQQEPEQTKDESHKQKEGVGATRENKDAIPTAGGERLGEKHWGESKIVPDVPKSQQEEQNVSSAEGQPDSMFYMSRYIDRSS